jgi:biotin synthase-like enzyme
MLLRRFASSSFHLARVEGLQRVYFSIKAKKNDVLIRNNWTREEISDIYNRPLINLVYDAATVHRMFHDPQQVQKATLLSIKTGGNDFICFKQ